jgi:hypothetical protein
MSTEESVECRSYTHARRHPQVIGRIQGYTLPSPWTPTQLGVLVVSFLALLWTRPLWAHLGGFLNLLVLLGVPASLMWCVRHLRMEGRAPVRMAAGVATYVVRPRGGTLHGRASRRQPPRRLGACRLFVDSMSR